MNEEINTISEEQVLHNKLNFEINKELIHLMKLIVELQQQNKKYKEVIDKVILIIKGVAYGGNEDYYIEKLKGILDILKEVE